MIILVKNPNYKRKVIKNTSTGMGCTGKYYPLQGKIITDVYMLFATRFQTCFAHEIAYQYRDHQKYLELLYQVHRH